VKVGDSDAQRRDWGLCMHVQKQTGRSARVLLLPINVMAHPVVTRSPLRFRCISVFFSVVRLSFVLIPFVLACTHDSVCWCGDRCMTMRAAAVVKVRTVGS
jgi:hypothetical protein